MGTYLHPGGRMLRFALERAAHLERRNITTIHRAQPCVMCDAWRGRCQRCPTLHYLCCWSRGDSAPYQPRPYCSRADLTALRTWFQPADQRTGGRWAGPHTQVRWPVCAGAVLLGRPGKCRGPGQRPTNARLEKTGRSS